MPPNQPGKSPKQVRGPRGPYKREGEVRKPPSRKCPYPEDCNGFETKVPDDRIAEHMRAHLAKKHGVKHRRRRCSHCDLKLMPRDLTKHVQRRHTPSEGKPRRCELCEQAWWQEAGGGGRIPVDTFEEHQAKYCPKREGCDDWEGELGHLVRKENALEEEDGGVVSRSPSSTGSNHASSSRQNRESAEVDKTEHYNPEAFDPYLYMSRSPTPTDPHYPHHLQRSLGGRRNTPNLTQRQALRYDDLFH